MVILQHLSNGGTATAHERVASLAAALEQFPGCRSYDYDEAVEAGAPKHEPPLAWGIWDPERGRTLAIVIIA